MSVCVSHVKSDVMSVLQGFAWGEKDGACGEGIRPGKG